MNRRATREALDGLARVVVAFAAHLRLCPRTATLHDVARVGLREDSRGEAWANSAVGSTLRGGADLLERAMLGKSLADQRPEFRALAYRNMLNCLSVSIAHIYLESEDDTAARAVGHAAVAELLRGHPSR